jgi:hypothetical protein
LQMGSHVKRRKTNRVLARWKNWNAVLGTVSSRPLAVRRAKS